MTWSVDHDETVAEVEQALALICGPVGAVGVWDWNASIEPLGLDAVCAEPVV